MSTKLRCIAAAALAVVFIDLMVIGVKIFDGNYNIAAEGVIGVVGFAAVGVCGFIGLYRELKKRRQSKKG